MKRLFLGLGMATAIFAVPIAANAYPGRVVADLNLRTCASTRCVAVAVIPRGAPVDILGAQGAWNFVTYGGVSGYASASYIAVGGYQRSPVYVAPPPPPPPPPIVVRPYPAYPVYPVYPRYPRYPHYPGYYVEPGFSLNFRFGG